MANLDDFNAMFDEESVPVADEGFATVPSNTAEAVVPKAKTSNVPANVSNKGAMSLGDDFTIGLPEALEKEAEFGGMMVGEIGAKISRVPIEKYKASSLKIDRIGFITNKVIGIKFHYIEGAGSIICFGKKCCEVGGMPQVRYLFPIVVYSTDNDGNVTGKKVDLRILSAGEDLYKSIQTIARGAEQQGGIDKIDMMVTCTDDKYQKISLSYAGPAAWRKSKAAVEYLTERWMEDGANAYMAVARKVDEDSFKKLIGEEIDGGAETAFNPANNTDLSAFFDD